MIRIGSLSEKHDRRAPKEGFSKNDCDSGAEFSDDDDEELPDQQYNDLSIPSLGNSTSMIPPSIDSNRNSLSRDALKLHRKNLASSNVVNPITKRKPASKSDRVAGSRFQSQMR